VVEPKLQAVLFPHTSSWRRSSGLVDHGSCRRPSGRNSRNDSE
jgi:hypothetical protein